MGIPEQQLVRPVNAERWGERVNVTYVGQHARAFDAIARSFGASVEFARTDGAIGGKAPCEAVLVPVVASTGNARSIEVRVANYRVGYLTADDAATYREPVWRFALVERYFCLPASLRWVRSSSIEIRDVTLTIPNLSRMVTSPDAPQTPVPPPAAWYPDPEDATLWRYWDGNTWTDHKSKR